MAYILEWKEKVAQEALFPEVGGPKTRHVATRRK